MTDGTLLASSPDGGAGRVRLSPDGRYAMTGDRVRHRPQGLDAGAGTGACTKVGGPPSDGLKVVPGASAEGTPG